MDNIINCRYCGHKHRGLDHVLPDLPAKSVVKAKLAAIKPVKQPVKPVPAVVENRNPPIQEAVTHRNPPVNGGSQDRKKDRHKNPDARREWRREYMRRWRQT